MGIKFAPLSLPMARRLQTFAVFTYMNLFFFGAIVTLCLSYFFFFHTPYQWIPLLYWAWYFYDYDTGETGGRSREWQ